MSAQHPDLPPHGHDGRPAIDPLGREPGHGPPREPVGPRGHDESLLEQPQFTLAVTPVAVPALSSATRSEATLLFADLFGYSAFTEEREIEQVAAAIGEIKCQSVRIVHAHGGIVNQFVGDEVMAIFGFPRGKQDAQQRAVEAALELHDFVRSIGLQPWLGRDRQLRLHSGIDSGLVLVRTRDVRNGLFELTGGAVIRAARLRSAAAEDELLVSHRVQRRIAGIFHTEPLQARTFKGSSESAIPFRVHARREPAARPRDRVTQSVSARSELSQLQRFWADRSAQCGGLVVVQGSAGSGKSRLLESFGSQLAAEDVWLWSTRGRHHDCEPFSTLARMATERPCRPESEQSSAAVSLWTEALRELSNRAAQKSALRKQPQTLDRFTRRIAALLIQRVEATTARHVFLVDDLQWVDSSSLALLVQLAGRLCPQGSVFVGAIREDAAHSDALARLRGAVPEELCATIQLGPLRLSDASQVVAEQLGVQQLSGSQLIERLALLSDGTPLNLVELVHLLLEDKYLQAHNGDVRLEAAALERLQLTPSARKLIERRIRSLSPQSARLLRAAAVMRDTLDLDQLARVTRFSTARAQAALEEAAAARLVERDVAGQPRFAHDLIWEVLLLNMSQADQAAWHRRAALALRALPERGNHHHFALARHCAAGLMQEDARGSFEALRTAAGLAQRAYDDALALSFLQQAAQAKDIARFEPGTEFYADLAETAFRAGELQVAYDAFEAAVQRLDAGFERAHLLGRMAWISHYHASGAAAQVLEQALRECGEAVAHNALGALTSATSARLRRALRRRSRPRTSRQSEIVCGLYLGLGRVQADEGQLGRALAAMMHASVIADDLPECRVRAQVDAMYGFFLGVTGARAQSQRRFARCQNTAQALLDPVALAYFHQISQVFALYQGDFVAAEHHARESVVVRGVYMELSELCLICLGQVTAELYRGRIDRVLAWAGRAIERIQQEGHAPAVFTLIEDAVCGVLVSHGRQDEVVRLKGRLRVVRRTQLGKSGFYHHASFQYRMAYVNTGALPNPAFEALVQEFAQLGLNPRRVPLGALVFYVQVAHLRVTQCLRTNGAARSHYVSRLRAALADVEASARLPMMHSHRHVLESALRWLEGKPRLAERHLLEAEALARRFGIAWVSFAAARLRAHMLRAQGSPDAARDQAQLAALLARQHGQLDHLSLIREEFELDQPA